MKLPSLTPGSIAVNMDVDDLDSIKDAGETV